MFKKRLMTSLSVALFAVSLMADQSLKSALNLDVEQARQVDAIQAKYRVPFAAKRQVQNQELANCGARGSQMTANRWGNRS